MPRSSRNSRYWLRMLAWSIAAATTATAMSAAFGGATWRTPWRAFVEPFAIAMLFTVSIVPIAGFAMPRLMRTVRGRVPFPLDWVVLFAAMVVIGVAGSAVAIGVLWSAGYIPAGRVWLWFGQSLRTSIVMTLLFGMSISALEAMRSRLDAATLALRTKERDEADARRLAAEAQLASLESRVNPHFLFNTLNSIATLVHQNPDAAERMITQFAALLRSSLDTATPLVALDEELAIVRTYLDIERVRFGDRLRSDVQVANGAGRALVPRLSVQTLVENSIKYAISRRREGATVSVHAMTDSGGLRVTVTDDGPGFDASVLPDGHGLALLRARLAMAFGDRGSLRIDSVPGRTTATIAVPIDRDA